MRPRNETYNLQRWVRNLFRPSMLSFLRYWFCNEAMSFALRLLATTLGASMTVRRDRFSLYMVKRTSPATRNARDITIPMIIGVLLFFPESNEKNKGKNQ